jgi:ADP-ribosylglycohydrolase
MRVAFIGLLYDDLDRGTEVARASALLTHGHPTALDAAAAAALMVAMALQDATPQHMYDEIENRCCDSSANFSAKWSEDSRLADSSAGTRSHEKCSG